ncbi:MAG: primosomal protein N', partial [Candidatus Methylomirabilota bacterium]
MTRSSPLYADVVFSTALEATLTYRLPASLGGAAAPGARVLVPLGSRMVTGYLVGVRESSPVAETKDVAELLDPEPLLDAHLLALTRWTADYYLCPWGEAIRTALPPGIDTFTRRRVDLTADGRAALEGRGHLPPDEAELLAALARGPVAERTLARRLGDAGRLTRALVSRGLVVVAADLTPPRVRPLQVPTCFLAPGVDPETVPLPARAARQRAILRAVAAASGGLPRAEAAGGSPAALAALIRRLLVEVREVEVRRDPFAGVDVPRDAARRLEPAQAAALAAVQAAAAEPRFAPFLLHGVTGSGKTEVYLQAIESVLAAGRQALVLVPEIALTPLTATRFLARFGSRVAVLHSGLTGGERFDAWRRIRAGDAAIVVGARSAVFAPLPRLGILVVDEEHDPSYKQEESPRYHGRDVAVMRAKMLGVPVVLGSATPAFESMERAQAGRYRLLALPDRIAARPLPEVRVVDLRRARSGERLLSPPLCEAIDERLERGEQSLLFLNRRGFSTLLLCQECGATLGCPRCSISLTFHAARRRLCCHTCDFERKPPDRCPACQGNRLRYLGFGTQQVEEAVKARFPAARVARMDR